jgi:hypothetical protein
VEGTLQLLLIAVKLVVRHTPTFCEKNIGKIKEIAKRNSLEIKLFK